jgi:hypothetical protein
MELKNYQQYLDDLFNEGRLWRHRTLRTVLDEDSTEWKATTIKQKIEILTKIYNAESETLNYFTLFNIIRDYRIFYLEEKKPHVVDRILPTLNYLLQFIKNKELENEIKYFRDIDFNNPRDKYLLKTFDPVINLFINDLKVSPHFFILAIMMEHPQLYELKTNAIPFYVTKFALSHLPKTEPHSIPQLAKISQDRIVEIFETENLHDREYALRFYHIVQYINNHLDGGASNIWKNVSNKQELIQRLMDIPFMIEDKAEKIITYLTYIHGVIWYKDEYMKRGLNDFLLQSYFGKIENTYDTAINRAYRDFNRTLKDFFKEDKNVDKIKVRSGWHKIVKEFIDEVVGKSYQNNEDFDKMHEKYCKKLINSNNLLYDKLTIGQAQKWLNMTLKYLMILEAFEAEEIEKNRQYFHVPIDNVIQDSLEIKFMLPKRFGAWSKIDDYEAYLKYQDDIRKICDNEYPIGLEIILFNEDIRNKKYPSNNDSMSFINL